MAMMLFGGALLLVAYYEDIEPIENDILGLSYFERFADLVIADLGSPPDLEQARSLAETLQFEYAIQGPGELYWLSPGLDIPERDWQLVRSLTDRTQIVRAGGRRGLQLVAGAYRYTLFDSRGLFTGNRASLYFVAATALGSLLLSYVLVRRLLRPVRSLRYGAQRISSGDLDFRVQDAPPNEFGELTSSINTMADSLQQMLDAKQQLLLAISHELRTPITRAKLQLEFIENSGLQAGLREDLDELELLVQELLEAERLNSKHAALNLEVVEFNSYIDQLLGQLWQEHPRLQFLPTTDAVMVKIDTLRLSLLLRNLVNNALRYGEEDVVSVEINVTESRCRLSVKDRGKGISAEHLPYLTEPFYRVDAARRRDTGGYGLGLYLCLLIAQAHRGRLLIESAVGTGTTVSLDFPRL
jgi:signal transduction histidine kinase